MSDDINIEGINPHELHPKKPVKGIEQKETIKLPIQSTTDALTNKREELIYKTATVPEGNKRYVVTVGYSTMSYAVILSKGDRIWGWSDIKGRFKITQKGWWKTRKGWKLALFVLKHNLTRLI